MKKPSRILAAFAGTLILSAAAAHATVVAYDDFQSYGSLSYGSNGGFGLGAIQYLEGTGGGVYLETGGAAISGGQSMGIYSSSGGQGTYRALDSSLGFMEYDVQARFNLDNSVAFSGFNIKTGVGASFGANELISFGLTPGTGNTSIFVGGSVNQTISLGSEIRGSIIDFDLVVDTGAGTYSLGAKFDGAGSYTTVSGNLKASGADVADLGFANFNTGTNQNLIVDNISVVPEPSSVALLVGSTGVLYLFQRRKTRA